MGFLGCLEVSARPCYESVEVSAYRAVESVEPRAWKVGGDVTVSASPACSIGELVDMYIPFLVTEGVFILVDGSIFKVLRT